MDPVVAHLEAGQAGTLALPGLQADQVVAGMLGKASVLVELGVEALGDHSAVADHHRWVLHQGARQGVGQRREGVDMAAQLVQRAALAVGLESGLKVGQGDQGIAQAGQVARARAVEGHAGQDPLHVADRLEGLAQWDEALVIEQQRHRRLTATNLFTVAQWAIEPALEQSRAHGGGGGVEHAGQGVVAAAAQVHVDLQVATAGRIDHHGVVAALHADSGDVWQGRALGIPGIVDQHASGGDGGLQVGAAEAAQVLDLELVAQGARRALEVEQPVALATQAATPLQGGRQGQAFGNQQLGGVEALKLGEHLTLALDLQHVEAAAGELQPGQPPALAERSHGDQQVVAAGIEQRLVVERARGDDAHHAALYRSLAGGRVADLLADRHRLAGSHQAGQVPLGAVVGHPGHGNRLARGLAALGQGDVEQGGGTPGIVEEQLVEVTHAIEEQHVGVLALDLQVLAHHGSMLGTGL